MKYTALIVTICFWFTACTRLDVFEQTNVIPKQTWYYNYKPVFAFTITDTTAVYNVFIVLRHTDAYEYNNLWLAIGSKAPGGDMQSQNVDIILGYDATGWEGNGMDDIFELRKNITQGPVPFKRAGRYTFTISQIMRENPVKHIMNVGVRVEKVKF